MVSFSMVKVPPVLSLGVLSKPFLLLGFVVVH